MTSVEWSHVRRVVALDPWPSVALALHDGTTQRLDPRWPTDRTEFAAELQDALNRSALKATGGWSDAPSACFEPCGGAPPSSDPYRGEPLTSQSNPGFADVALMRLRASLLLPGSALATEVALTRSHLYARRRVGWGRIPVETLRVRIDGPLYVFGRRAWLWLPWDGPVRRALDTRLSRDL